jgi:hypothetical protein
VTGALSLATLAELNGSNAALFGRLTGRALPLVILTGLCGLAVLAPAHRRLAAWGSGSSPRSGSPP